MDENEEEHYGPEFEVWIHLSSGIDLARVELDALDDTTRKSVERFAKLIVPSRKAFALPADESVWTDLFDVLLEDDWYRFAAEIELGREGVDRASEALKRFLELKPVFTQYKLDEKATAYLREAVDTYLFGFDAACIAFCGAALEQVLRQVVVDVNLYTEPRLERERPTGNTLLEACKRAGKLEGVYDAAKRTLDQRNRVMHRHIWEDRILQGIARGTVIDLGTVLATIGDTP